MRRLLRWIISRLTKRDQWTVTLHGPTGRIVADPVKLRMKPGGPFLTNAKEITFEIKEDVEVRSFRLRPPTDS